MYTIHKREDFMFPRNSITYFVFSKCGLNVSLDFLKTNSKKIIEECTKEFQYRYTFHPNRYLVDNRPEVWFYVFISSYENTETWLDVKVPNGCCNSVDCPINLFYEIIYNYLKKLSKE